MFYKKTLEKYFNEYNSYIANIQCKNEELTKKYEELNKKCENTWDYLKKQTKELDKTDKMLINGCNEQREAIRKIIIRITKNNNKKQNKGTK